MYILYQIQWALKAALPLVLYGSTSRERPNRAMCAPEVWLWGLLGLRVFPLKPRQPEQLRWCGPARGPSPSTLNRTHHCCSLCANQ